MSRIAWIVIAIAALVPLSASAKQDYDFAGAYEVYGHNPDGESTYSGEVSIAWSGETYHVEWYIGDQLFIGTGIGLGDVLSVGYDGGTAVYQLQEDRSLYGFWSPFGGES